MKKQNYTIKSLSLTLLVVSCALLNFTRLDANPKRIEKAILIFHEHSRTPDPKISWQDFVEIVYQLLRETEFKDGAESLKRYQHEKRPNVVGPMLKNIAKKMPPAIRDAIKKMQDELTNDELTRRFKASVAKACLAEAELKDRINKLITD